MKVRIPPLEMDAQTFMRLSDYIEDKQAEAIRTGGKRRDVSRQGIIEIAVKQYLDRYERRVKYAEKKAKG